MIIYHLAVHQHGGVQVHRAACSSLVSIALALGLFREVQVSMESNTGCTVIRQPHYKIQSASNKVEIYKVILP